MFCVAIKSLLNTYSGRIPTLHLTKIYDTLKVLCDLFIIETHVSGVKVIPNVLILKPYTCGIQLNNGLRFQIDTYFHRYHTD